jgi:hypothetical protein
MEKLKSWIALSKFPTTTAAAPGIYVLKIELVEARVQNLTEGLTPAHFPGLLDPLDSAQGGL